jgi:hypothetical protein
LVTLAKIPPPKPSFSSKPWALSATVKCWYSTLKWHPPTLHCAQPKTSHPGARTLLMPSVH